MLAQAGGGSIRRVAPGAGAAAGVVTFANDILNGRNPVDAAGHSAAVAAGTVVGTVACASFGPIGAMVCGSLGGAVGGALYDNFFHPQGATVPTEPLLAPPPFYGGQSEQKIYLFKHWNGKFWDLLSISDQYASALSLRGKILAISDLGDHKATKRLYRISTN